ncbi:hypothetical protein [Candidatus Hodarchaeum mangrovi]
MQDVNRDRFLFLQVIIDYLKINSHRIAHHVLTRTPNPLSSREDFKSLISYIDGYIADILTLDANSYKTFVKSVQFDDLVAHFHGDYSLNESLSALEGKGLENIHYIFVTNGVLIPTLVSEEFLSNYTFLKEITFLETRFEPKSIHAIGNPSIYLRKVVSQIKEILPFFEEVLSDMCSCGGIYHKGKYQINYWGKSLQIEYSVCPSCGIQKEAPENAGQVMNFVQKLSAE